MKYVGKNLNLDDTKNKVFFSQIFDPLFTQYSQIHSFQFYKPIKNILYQYHSLSLEIDWFWFILFIVLLNNKGAVSFIYLVSWKRNNTFVSSCLTFSRNFTLKTRTTEIYTRSIPCSLAEVKSELRQQNKLKSTFALQCSLLISKGKRLGWVWNKLNLPLPCSVHPNNPSTS